MDPRTNKLTMTVTELCEETTIHTFAYSTECLYVTGTVLEAKNTEVNIIEGLVPSRISRLVN